MAYDDAGGYYGGSKFITFIHPQLSQTFTPHFTNYQVFPRAPAAAPRPHCQSDHVVPPYEGVPADEALCHLQDRCGAQLPFDFRRLGLRTAAMLISPMVAQGVIQEPNGPFDSSQFELTSVASTVKNLFNLSNFLTKRDEWAGETTGKNHDHHSNAKPTPYVPNDNSHLHPKTPSTQPIDSDPRSLLVLLNHALQGRSTSSGGSASVRSASPVIVPSCRRSSAR